MQGTLPTLIEAGRTGIAGPSPRIGQVGARGVRSPFPLRKSGICFLVGTQFDMQEAFPEKIKVQSRSVTEDACVIATAQNLAVAGFSSFDVGLTRLNVNLKHLFVPFGDSEPHLGA